MSVKQIPFSCKRDNLTIRGLCFIPNGTDLPVAIISHGFTANHLSSITYARGLAEQGYLALCFDFCGGCTEGASDGKSEHMSVFTEMDDIRAVIAYAKTLPNCSGRVVLVGTSQGGLASALVAAQPRQEIDALVLVSPALCIPDDVRKGRAMAASFDPCNVPEVILGNPIPLGRCYVDAVANMDVFSAISDYSGNVLIIHGGDDQIVSIGYSRQAEAAYAHATRCALQVLEGAGHSYTEDEKLRALAYMSDFLQDIQRSDVYL